MMTKYDRLLQDLEAMKTGKMKCFGNSMLPILSNPSINTYEIAKTYNVGDIVFCKVKGRYIDAHLITKKDGDRYMISNNHGHENGWTRQIFGRVVKSEDVNGNVNYRRN